MFIDRATVEMVAGDGGDGIISWRREKYLPKGGPYGGDGGDGGSVVLRASENVYALDAYRHKRFVRARNGAPGGSNCQTGKSGETLTLLVPCGTLIKDLKTEEVLADLTEPDQEFLVCQGGKGGRGNYSFKSPTNQAPYQFTKGTEGDTRLIELELKLIADVGLVGFPNAGKSTLISKVTFAKVKTAPYPFTTLHPNLGYVSFEGGDRVLLADIPGIIQGAHENKGLGLEFLKHIERTKALVYVIDGSGIDGRHPSEDLKVLQDEISSYHSSLLVKPFLVVYNKVDTEEARDLFWEEFIESCTLPRDQVIRISALTGEGIPHFLEQLKKFAHA